jgi:cellulose synthase/poly-beta-1,6-N-acetylglucosamine synthase-like glycosyltransferase
MSMAIALFAFGAIFILYALFGYPLLLLVWGKLAPRAVRRAPIRPSVSVLIPVRNGAPYLRRKLESVFALEYPREQLEVIVVSDGSTDGSASIAREFTGVSVIELPPGGKCAALNAAMARATSDILFFTDVRQPLDRGCLARLVTAFADPTIGVVSGELVIVRGDHQEHANVGLYVRFEEWLRKRISAVGSVAGATGAAYAMRRELAVPLPEQVLVDDMYQPISAYFQGFRVILDGDAIAYDEPTRVADEFRRKVRTLAGIYQIAGLFPRLFNPRYGIGFHFLSHKFARLILPWAFLLVLITSFWLPEPWRTIALAGQAGLYGLALLDLVLPGAFPLKRIPSLCRHFVTLLAASIVATSILFRPSRSLWTERTAVGPPEQARRLP